MKFMRSFAQGAAVAACAALTAAPAAAESWRGWNIHPEGYPNTVAMDLFAKEVADKTGGRIKLTMYHSGVLGSQPDAIEQVRSGALAIGNFNLGPMGPIVPMANVVSLPFVFNDVPHMHRVMDGAVGDFFSAEMAKKGLVALAWYDSGARSLYNSKRPIKTPKDVVGMKIRVMNNDIFVKMIAALGGNATPMAFSEVYQSLSTGVIDGAENNYPSYESTGHFEVAGFYSITEHLIIPECVCIAKSVWDKLSDADKKIVREAARNSAKKQRELWAERSKKSFDLVVSKGAKVNTVTDKKPFQDAMKVVYDDFFKTMPEAKAVVEKIRAVK
ncbi:MAG: TRAP transporter substrate-binding protein [Neomegalonema sp.]|nr:TRAP transporter substrate-binding protein [Neomegalonema sp.]